MIIKSLRRAILKINYIIRGQQIREYIINIGTSKSLIGNLVYKRDELINILMRINYLIHKKIDMKITEGLK